VTAKREFLTTNEVAQILGISPFTVRRYIQTRKLKAVKLENSYRIRQSHLDDFIRAREIETEAELAPATSVEQPRHSVTPLKRRTAPATRPARRSKPRPSTRRKQEE
jgi:excisionase family DNA binding protein